MNLWTEMVRYGVIAKKATAKTRGAAIATPTIAPLIDFTATLHDFYIIFTEISLRFGEEGAST